MNIFLTIVLLVTVFGTIAADKYTKKHGGERPPYIHELKNEFYEN